MDPFHWGVQRENSKRSDWRKNQRKPQNKLLRGEGSTAGPGLWTASRGTWQNWAQGEKLVSNNPQTPRKNLQLRARHHTTGGERPLIIPRPEAAGSAPIEAVMRLVAAVAHCWSREVVPSSGQREKTHTHRTGQEQPNPDRY